MNISERLAQEFSLKQEYSDNIISLIKEGNTIPFIARYRKELHGTCDDQELRKFNDRLSYLENLISRKQEVQKAIEGQEKWTEEIALALDKAETMTEVEDIYRPFKKKKKTRASVAIEKGLQALADLLILGSAPITDFDQIAMPFLNEEKGVLTTKDAFSGAKDIVAEIISDDADIRKELREKLYALGNIATVLDETKENSHIFGMYKDYSEKISAIPGHRILAINRGEKEDCLKVSINLDTQIALDIINLKYVKPATLFQEIMLETTLDSYTRLIYSSIEREVRSELTEKANEGAIKLFESNLKPLLMQPPLKSMVVLGLDPAYRTGCKIAVVNAHGDVVDNCVIYPTPPQSKIEEATKKLCELIEKHKVDAISIGNGTASKEAEIFVVNLIKECNRKVAYMVVNEAGASVYSASELAAEEFPEFDVSIRSAVSIARRLQDPLAELIKIDVKSIGVGQYQHDMPQKRLTEVLDGVVEDCVNKVGVDLNTASYSLLANVSGLNLSVAKNIVKAREKKAFSNRKELLKVSKLGPKAFEQCAGFLRILGGDEVLDSTSVHPEAYDATQKLLTELGYTQEDVRDNKLEELSQRVEKIGINKLANSIGVGVPTLEDILIEIAKPGRDIRDDLPKPILRDDLMDIKDLKEGMEITGTVRNVIDFGAFIDIGVHQDGLVHISEISNDFIKHPSDALKVGDVVIVKVIGVDTVKGRISLTIKGASGAKPKSESTNVKPQMRNNRDFNRNKPMDKNYEDKTQKQSDNNTGLSMSEMLAKLQKKFNR